MILEILIIKSEKISKKAILYFLAFDVILIFKNIKKHLIF